MLKITVGLSVVGETQLLKREPANLINNKVWELEFFMDTLFAAELRRIGRGVSTETPLSQRKAGRYAQR